MKKLLLLFVFLFTANLATAQNIAFEQVGIKVQPNPDVESVPDESV